MRVLVATSNPHKLEELSAILSARADTEGTGAATHSDIVLFGLEALPSIPPEPVEDGATFEANARIKAIAYATATGCIALADDSGLEVDALGGAPGVHSAYYAGRDGSRRDRDARNNARLLAELRGVPVGRRTARFVCAMCLAEPDGTVIAETRGTFEGVIVDSPRGSGGFGYDPLLLLPDLGVTSAELSSEEKNARSHRGMAARRMLPMLRARAAQA